MLTVAGLQVPVMALVDDAGNTGTVPFSQIVKSVPKLKAGVTLGVTVTVKVVGNAHWPAAGVKV